MVVNKQFAKELLLVVVGRAVPAVGAIFFSIIIGAVLGLQASSAVFLWVATLYLVGFVFRFGYDVSFLRPNFKESSEYGEIKRTVFVFSLFAGLLVGSGFNSVEASVLFLALPFFSVSLLNSSILRSKGDGFKSGLVEVSSISCVSALVIGAVVFLGVEIQRIDVVLIFLFSAMFVFFLSEVWVGISASVAGGYKLQLDKLFFSSCVLLLPALLIYTIQWLPVYFLSFGEEEGVSIYSIAVRVASGFAFIAVSIDFFVAPKFSRMYYNNDSIGMRRMVSVFRRIAVCIVVPVVLLFYMFGEYFLALFLGEAAEGIFLPALILMLSYAVMLLVGPYQYLLIMSRRENVVVLANFFSLSLVLICGFVAYTLSCLSPLVFSVFVFVSRVGSVIFMACYGNRHVVNEV